jgi:hypothetical protein
MATQNNTKNFAITNTGSGLDSSFKIFGVTFNLKLTLFVLGSIAFGITGIMYFNNNKQYISMAIFIPLTLIILIVYGNRWFGPQGSANSTLSRWPPQINTCPDYLTYYKLSDSTGKSTEGCIDMVGISTNGGFQKVSEPSAIKSATDTSHFFPLIVGETRAALCGRLRTAGLTWEGVYDGVSCLSSNGSGTSIPSSGTTCSTNGT